MKRYLAVALLALAVALGFATRGKQTGARADQSFETPRLVTESSAGRRLPLDQSPRVSSRTTEQIQPEVREEALVRIEDAVKTYEPAAVKTIAAFLTDPDRELRSAAREGLIQLGEGDGIAALRLAATRMSDPAETNACREAADFLELPSWSDTAEARETIADLIAHPEPPPPPP